MSGGSAKIDPALWKRVRNVSYRGRIWKDLFFLFTSHSLAPSSSLPSVPDLLVDDTCCRPPRRRSSASTEGLCSRDSAKPLVAPLDPRRVETAHPSRLVVLEAAPCLVIA